MRDRHTDIVRVGVVSSIDYDKCTAQVVFKDRDNIVSDDLHILVPLTLKDCAYYMPDINERVLCIFDPSSPTTGYIVASFYADTRTPPITNKDKRYIKFGDDALVEYDRDKHTLKIDLPTAAQDDLSVEVFSESNISVVTNGSIAVEAKKNVTIKSAQNLNVETAEDVTINSAGSVCIDAVQTMTIMAVHDIKISSDASVNIDARDVNLYGEMTLRGDITHYGAMVNYPLCDEPDEPNEPQES